jgi:hypothetical protein
MPTVPQNAGFTGTNGVFDTASIDGLISSFSNEFTRTTGTRSATRSDNSASQTATDAANTSATGAASSSQTTLATSVSPTAGVPDSGSQGSGISGTGTATNAASNTSPAVTVSEKSSCNSISCSPALKAAVAVPIVVAAIAAIFLFFFCARRRRRRRAGAVVNEKRPAKTGKKKWTRHLRAFSFDAELLMGGRFSSSNSLRSRDPSIRSAAGTSSRNGAHSVEPSLHSVEEVAPPYRDAVSHATPASPPRSVPPVTTRAIDPIPRPSSTATAPPPYRSTVDGPSPEPPHSPSAARNPFSDSAPVSPIDESPFNDPPESGGALAPALSRGSSMYRSVMTDDAATPTASENGSIREAVVGRRVSLRNNGSTSGGGGSS